MCVCNRFVDSLEVIRSKGNERNELCCFVEAFCSFDLLQGRSDGKTPSVSRLRDRREDRIGCISFVSPSLLTFDIIICLSILPYYCGLLLLLLLQGFLSFILI